MSMRVGVRNISNACVSRKMRESWKVWSVTTRKEYKNSYRARVGLFISEFVISGQSHI